MAGAFAVPAFTIQVYGRSVQIPAAELQVNDTVILKPGDRVPTDGEVLEGESAVDESMLTGESAPVEKAASAKLYAGTSTLNGRLLMRVTATGEALEAGIVLAQAPDAGTAQTIGSTVTITIKRTSTTTPAPKN